MYYVIRYGVKTHHKHTLTHTYIHTYIHTCSHTQYKTFPLGVKIFMYLYININITSTNYSTSFGKKKIENYFH